MPRLKNQLSSHLQSVDESYGEHCAHALRFAGKLSLATLCCFLHALLPFLFEKTGSRLVRELYGEMVQHRQDLSARRRGENTVTEAGREASRGSISQPHSSLGA